jgi:hypothetical protein
MVLTIDRNGRMLGRGRSRVLPLLSEIVILVIAYIAYEAVRRLVAPESGEALGRAVNLIEVEQQLGIFFEPHLQGLIVDHHWLVTLFNWIYVWGYLPVISAAGLYLYMFRHDFYTRYRNAFLLSGAIGLVIFATLPVAPPRMFPEFGFVDTVHLNSGLYSSIQNTDLVNEFAAVPSFHFGWILLVALALMQSTRALMVRIIAVLLPSAMLLAILFTANHFVLDALAGAVLVLGALGAVRLFESRVARRGSASLPAGSSAR